MKHTEGESNGRGKTSAEAGTKDREKMKNDKQIKPIIR